MLVEHSRARGLPLRLGPVVNYPTADVTIRPPAGRAVWPLFAWASLDEDLYIQVRDHSHTLVPELAGRSRGLPRAHLVALADEVVRVLAEQMRGRPLPSPAQQPGLTLVDHSLIAVPRVHAALAA